MREKGSGGELFGIGCEKKHPQRAAPSALKRPAAFDMESYYNNQTLQSSAPLQLKNNHCSLLIEKDGVDRWLAYLHRGEFFRDQRRAGDWQPLLPHLQKHFWRQTYEEKVGNRLDKRKKGSTRLPALQSALYLAV